MTRRDNTSGLLPVLFDLEGRIKSLTREAGRLRRSLTLQKQKIKGEISLERKRLRQERVEAEERAAASERYLHGYVPFRRFLRKLRQARGLTIAGAARAIGIGRSYLGCVENGQLGLPKLNRLGGFARVYGMPERRMQILGFIDRAPLSIRRTLIYLMFPDDCNSEPLGFSSLVDQGGDTTTPAPRRSLTFGRVLRLLRQARGLTQLQAGKLAKVDDGFVWVLENRGDRMGSPKLIRRLAKMYGVQSVALQILAYSARAPKDIQPWVLERLAPVAARLRDSCVPRTQGVVQEECQAVVGGS